MSDAGYYTIYKNNEYKGRAYGTYEGVKNWAINKYGSFGLVLERKSIRHHV